MFRLMMWIGKGMVLMIEWYYFSLFIMILSVWLVFWMMVWKFFWCVVMLLWIVNFWWFVVVFRLVMLVIMVCRVVFMCSIEVIMLLLLLVFNLILLFRLLVVILVVRLVVIFGFLFSWCNRVWVIMKVMMLIVVRVSMVMMRVRISVLCLMVVVFLEFFLLSFMLYWKCLFIVFVSLVLIGVSLRRMVWICLLWWVCDLVNSGLSSVWYLFYSCFFWFR